MKKQKKGCLSSRCADKIKCHGKTAMLINLYIVGGNLKKEKATALKIKAVASMKSNSLSAGLRVAFLSMPLQFLGKLKKGNNDINVRSAPLEVEITSQLIKTGVAQKMIYEKISCLHQRNKLVNIVFGGIKIPE